VNKIKQLPLEDLMELKQLEVAVVDVVWAWEEVRVSCKVVAVNDAL